MDFALPPDLVELQQRTRDFIRNKIMPLEGDSRQTRHGDGYGNYGIWWRRVHRLAAFGLVDEQVSDRDPYRRRRDVHCARCGGSSRFGWSVQQRGGIIWTQA